MHLDEPAFDDDRDQVLDRARLVGVRWFVNIGHTPLRWRTSARLRDRHPDVAFSIGVHPLDADAYAHSVHRALRRAVHELNPVALGEMGLDFFRSSPPRAVQETAFRAQLDIAAEFALPIIIHQRNAAAEVMAILEVWESPAPIVLHSFDGTKEMAVWAADRGCLIGIGGLAIKPSSGELRDVLRGIPADRLLLETDSPYLAPPGAASRRNTPANLPLIAGLLAPLWDLSVEDLCARTTDNAERVFARDRQPDGTMNISDGAAPSEMPRITPEQ